jgi:hypothetical protein
MFDHDPNASIEQRDNAKTAAWTLRAPMLALTNPDPAMAFPEGTALEPQLFVRNTTGKPQSASLRFNWKGDTTTGKSQGPSLQLRPYETRRVDVAALQDGAILPKDAHWTSVMITTNSLPDEVMAIAASYDATLQHGAQTPFSDQLSFAWEGGMWEYDAHHNSLMTVGNGGTKPTRAALTLFYNQGTERYDLEQSLQPDEQMWIDIGKLIGQHIPDKTGKLLPADLSSGSYEFRDLGDPFGGTLFEGKVIYEKTYGHVTYGCMICCDDSAPWLISDPLGIPLLGSSPNGVQTEDCNANILDVSSRFYGNWATANPAIATVASNGTHTGVAVGSTTSGTLGLLMIQHGRICYNTQEHAGGNDNVPPTISQDRNLWFFGLGNTPPSSFTLGGISATLSASGAGNGTYVWTITNGTSKVVFENNSSTITKIDKNTVGITSTSYSTSANDVTVQLQFTPSGASQLSASYSLSIDSPYKLVSNGTFPDQGVAYVPGQSCSKPTAGSAGFLSQIPYKVLSFFGVAIANQYVTEAFANQQDIYVGDNWPVYVPGLPMLTAGDGTFADAICVAGAPGTGNPQPLQPQNPRSTVQVDQALQSWYIGGQSSGSGVEVQTDTILRFEDHGIHVSTSIKSPVR